MTLLIFNVLIATLLAAAALVSSPLAFCLSKGKIRSAAASWPFLLLMRSEHSHCRDLLL